LRDTKGETVAQGDLEVCIEPQGTPTAIAKRTITGGIDSASADLWPPRVKVCGHVKIKEKGVTVTIKACFSAGF
jgi:hypothetical protein